MFVMDGDERRRYAAEVLKLLKRRYRREMHTSLKFKDPWELLVCTVLSAQSTDASVNMITPALFARFGSVSGISMARPSDLYKYTKSIGLYRKRTHENNRQKGLGRHHTPLHCPWEGCVHCP